MISCSTCGWSGTDPYIPAEDSGLDGATSDLDHCPECYSVII